MKTRKWMIIVALATVGIFVAAPAVGQTINTRVDVPFDFAVGNAWLKSGNCLMQRASQGWIRLFDADNHSTFLRLTPRDIRSADDVRLVFHRYGDQYFLARVETPRMSYTTPISSLEKKLARQAAVTEIAVAARPDVAGK